MIILGFLPDGFIVVEMIMTDTMAVIKTTEIRLGDEGFEITRSIELMMLGTFGSFGFSGDHMDASDLDLSDHTGDDMPAWPTSRDGSFRFGAGDHDVHPVREMLAGEPA